MAETEQRYRIIILGAGFSSPAGLPLGNELWQEIRKRACNLRGRASKFEDDLQEYQAFRRDCNGIELKADDVDFEEFLGYLDVEFFLGLRGSDTWSDDGNESQVVVKTLIGQILTERTPQPTEIPDLYLEFAKRLCPNDWIITFNYDILLERALERVGKPFRLFPFRYGSVTEHNTEVDHDREEVVLLKVHGSVDWFDRRRYLKLCEARKPVGLPAKIDDPIFDRTDILTTPILGGPRFSNDPLKEMHRVRHIEQVYREPPLFLATPWLLTPSSMKVIYAIRDFWHGLGQVGALNLGMAIIGFSLQEHDEYARQVVYRMVRNYQQANWGADILGMRKHPVTIVDRRPPGPSRDEFRKRYAFVDWSKADCCFDGFSEGTLSQIFGS